MPARVLAAAMKTPRLCCRSEKYAVIHRTTTATAYGGTVSSCARAFAIGVFTSAEYKNKTSQVLTDSECRDDSRQEGSY